MLVEFATRPGEIAGLVVVTLKQITDDRGTVRELFRRSALAEAGVELTRVEQINVTQTRKGAVRGMHAEDMTKLVAIAHGRAKGVYVDTRRGSSTFGTVQTVDLEPGVQVLVPPGVANGFQALEDDTQYVYCFDNEWRPGMPGLAFTPLDPCVADQWPLTFDPTDTHFLSVKDREAPTFDEAVRA